MKTIEERAEEYSLKDFDGYYTGREKAVEEGYIAGATEQKEIDIEKACKCFCKTCRGQCKDNSHCDVFQVFRNELNAMEE